MTLEFTHSLDQKPDPQPAVALPSDSLTKLISLASNLKTIDPSRALLMVEEAILLAQTLGYQAVEARAWSIRAYAEAQIELDEDAYRHGQRALDLSKINQDPITMGYAYFGIGQYLMNQSRYDEALEVGLKGYDLLEQAGDIAAQANIAFIMMGSYSRLGDREQAEFYAFRAVEQYRDIHLPGGEVVQLNNLAMHFFWMEEYETARRLGEEALVILRRLMLANQPFDFAYTTGAIMHTLAEIAIAQEDWHSAEAFLQEGLRFVRGDSSQISPNDETFLMLGLGKFHYSRGSFDKARHALLSALWRSSRARHRVLMAEIAEVLMHLYQKVGQYRRALWYSHFYHNIDKLRYRDQLVSKMRRMEVEYEVKAARREMEMLTEKNQQLEQAYQDLQAANTQIRELSIRDGLTKLFNRQHFEEWAVNAFDQSVRGGTSFGVMLCDIDNFKRINDTWLHHIGDRVLQIVAAELQAACPLLGKVARYGGEEFVIAVPTYTLEQMKQVAEECRSRIEQYAWHTIHPEIRVTISSGVADNSNIESLTKQLIQADLYLYLAKRHGKNRVEGWEYQPATIDRRR
jgi:diguanylate cyclase (GGDEF)-like protein